MSVEALSRFVPSSACRIPRRRRGIIDRGDVVERLIDADAELVVVSAPPGYGKTTVATLWAEADGRPFAWVSLGRPDADLQYFVWHLATALDQVQPLSDELVGVIAGPGRSFGLEVMPALLEAVAGMAPFVLVLDDTQVLRSRDAAQVVDRLVDALPEGAAVALLGRNVAMFDVARRRVEEQVFELHAPDLAMSADEAGHLFAWSGLDLDAFSIADLVERTEGWPAALHLAELSLETGGCADFDLFSGRDRLVADYLVEEVLSGLPERAVWFLERSAVLDRMTAPLLDDLLDIHTSGEIIDALERDGNLFLVPLDNERRWYRYHHLFADLLRARLDLHSPTEALRLHARASRLLEADGDVDAAIRHAVGAGDRRRAAELILSQAAPAVLNGRGALISRWLDELGPNAVEDDPIAAMCLGWVGFGLGDPALVQNAIRSAQTAGNRVDDVERSREIQPCGDLFGAIMGEGGVAGAIERADAVLAVEVADPTWSTLARAVRGLARAVSGDRVDARADLLAVLPLLRELPVFDAAVRAHLALLDLDDGDLDRATRRAREALEIAHRERLEGVVAITVTFAVGSLLLARAGCLAESRAEFATAAALLERLDGSSTRTALLGHTVLAAAALALDDRSLARSHLMQADRARALEPAARQLNRLLEEIRAALAVDQSGAGRPALTPAELRLLPFLATHLALQKIADELYVSRNTVKSQAMAVYRKLGVTSRSEAVVVARELGLLAE